MNKQNYPLIIIKYAPYLFLCLRLISTVDQAPRWGGGLAFITTLVSNSVDADQTASPDLSLHCTGVSVRKLRKTRMMFIKHYAPNRCLCIKVAKSTMFN